MKTNNVNDLVISLNNLENNNAFNIFFADYIQKNKIAKLDDLKNLKRNALIKFLQEDEKGKQICQSKNILADQLEGRNNLISVYYEASFKNVKLNPDNIKTVVESFANLDVDHMNDLEASEFINYFADLFNGIPEDKQRKIDPLTIDKCLKKFMNFLFSNNAMEMIMKHTDLEKEILPENKSADAIVKKLDKIQWNQKAPESFIRFAFNFTDFNKFKAAENESGDERFDRHNLIYKTIYTLAKNDSANDWNEKIKNVFEKGIYKKLIDTIEGDEKIDHILSFERMQNIDYDLPLKNKLENTCLKFVVVNENGNKKIKLIGGKDDVCKKLKSQQIPSLIFSVLGISSVAFILFLSGFAWSWMLICGLGFLATFSLHLVSSIFCMNPYGSRVYKSKWLKNIAWMIAGITLIMTGGLFFAGIAAFVFIAFGCLSVATGILKSFVGSTANAFNASREMDAEQTDKYIKENVSKVSEKVKPLVMSHQIIMSAVFIFAMTVGIVLSLSLTAPYFVFSGIMISGLSFLGLLNSIFHVFGKGTPAQVKLHRYGKFLECTAFVLGGLSLILFGILPVSTAFAGLIGISSIALKFLLIAFGATSIFKSIKQYSRMSSNIKYLLAKQELKFTGLKMDKLKKWKKDLYDNTYNPKFDFADITLKNMEVCFDKKPVVQNNNQWITFFF